MNENVMSQLDAELEHAGEETALSPKMLLLEQLRITPEKQLKPMEFLFRLFGKPCFPRRELVAITGKAKSGKTFVTSMLMACCQVNEVLAFQRMREEPLHVLWYDTEQSDESTQDILKNRVMRMVGSEAIDQTTPNPPTQEGNSRSVISLTCGRWSGNSGGHYCWRPSSDASPTW